MRKVSIICDGTGITAMTVIKAVMTQFPGAELDYDLHKNVVSKDELDYKITEAAVHNHFIIYSIVNNVLREHCHQLINKHHIDHIDLLGPFMDGFSSIFDMQPQGKIGLLHAVNQNYFSKIEAIEFTLDNDGKLTDKAVDEADIILLGISRTSKTPLAVFLAQRGFKVVTYKIDDQVPLPEVLTRCDQRKIFALTVDIENMINIRRNCSQDPHYISSDTIGKEIQWSEKIYKENPRWPVFNVTTRPIEDTSAEIVELMAMRQTNQTKQNKRFK